MNYNYLRYFSVLAQTEHYTLAAARLGISQPSLSSAIHHLEDELGGIKLFEKVGRNIRLTEEGRYYQEKVDSALQELSLASTTLRDSKVSAPVVIRMGVVSGTLEGVVAQEIADYLQQNSRIRFHLRAYPVFQHHKSQPHSPYAALRYQILFLSEDRSESAARLFPDRR